MKNSDKIQISLLATKIQDSRWDKRTVKHRSIPHLFLYQVERFKNRTALREKDYGIWKEISWKEYGEHVRNFCLGLYSLGLKRGGHVSILSENIPEWLYADLAIQSAGGVSVGVYPTNPPPEVKYIVGHSESLFCICQDQEQVDKILRIWPHIKEKVQWVIVWDSRGMSHYYQQYPFLRRFE
ncbi:MAG: AMP-binding protein, partial [Candidatus Bathyarchaeia archaeon]